MDDLERELESLIHLYSTKAVLRAVSHVCFLKADSLLEANSRKPARLWLRAGSLILKLSALVEV
jgi:hypothetical protein